MKKYLPSPDSNEILKHIAARLHTARLLRHMTLEAMAQNLGITRKQLQNYEQAKCNLSIVRLWQISCLLNLSLTFFIEDLCAQKTLDRSDLEILQKLHGLKNSNLKKAFIDLLNDL